MKKFSIGFVLIIGFIVLAYWLAYPSYAWNQKVSITVETPDGLKSGSSVVAVKWSTGPKILPDPPSMSSRVAGEATVSILGPENICLL